MKKMHPSLLLRSCGEISQRSIENETLLVPLRTGPDEELKILLLNKTASEIWKMLDGTHSLAQIAHSIFQRFDVEADRAQADVISCCSDLMDSGLIEEVST